MALLSGALVLAQVPVATPAEDPGVARLVLIDKPEVSALRVEL